MNIPPIAAHSWLPTPSCGSGGTKDGNFNLLCQKCRVKITKADLINDAVPPTCVRAQRVQRAAA
jgi:hypothetical protein